MSFQSFHHKRKTFDNRYWNFDWNHVPWSDETKSTLFGNQHSRWVWCKNKKNAYTENNLYVSMVRFCDVVGLFFLQRPWEPCYMASWTPWNTRKCLIWIWLPLSGNYNWVVVGSSSRTMIKNIHPTAEHKNWKSSFWHGHLSPLP